MKNLHRNLILFFMLMALIPYASAQFRELNSSDFDENDIPSSINSSSQNISKAGTLGHTIETINTSVDRNQKLYGVVGKTQILNFDKNITRVSMTDNKYADIVVISPKQILINGKKAGATSVVFWGAKNSDPVFYNLVIQQNADGFIQAIEHVAPNEDISIIFNDKGAVMSGKLSSTAVKEKIANIAQAYGITLTDITESPAKQVLLEVKVTEASKNFARSIGVHFVSGSHINTSDSDKFNIGGWGAKGNRGYVVQSGGDGLSLGFFKNGVFGIDLEASEGKGDIKILAEPKLLAVNGEEGSFSVGNQVPVPSEMGNYGNISYEYKDTGVILKFTPTILEDSGRVRLELKPEVSEVDTSVSVTSATGAAVYGFKTRKVETTVELMDGETLVIAGLKQNHSARGKTQVPILGNLPVVGHLFGVTSEDKQNDELVIFITPRIIDNSQKMTDSL